MFKPITVLKKVLPTIFFRMSSAIRWSIFFAASIQSLIKCSTNYKNRRQSFLPVKKVLDTNECRILIDALERRQGAGNKDVINCTDSLKRIFISIKENSNYYFEFPLSIFDNYKYILNPSYQVEEFDWDEFFSRALPIMESFYGTHVKVECIELYKTFRDVNSHENAKAHVDGDHKTSARMLLYLNEVTDKKDGPLVIIRDDIEYEVLGTHGDGAIFFNSRETHLGISPRCGDRYCLNLKFFPTIGCSKVSVPKRPLNRVSALY